MATTRVMGRPEKTPADDGFLEELYRGGELLAAGKVIEAKEHLERAHRLQPRHEKAQNLLGLTYFKLGLFEQAAELYEMLVRDSPVDPTLRVNLGLVYLKTSALQRAVREFETATDLAPEHKKAHNYLGLALAQLGEYGRAREHFLLAGSDAMAERMSRAIAGEGFSRPAPEQPAQARGFAEIEGTEVVREHGGQPVGDMPPPAEEAQVTSPPAQKQVLEPRAPAPAPMRVVEAPAAAPAPSPRQAEAPAPSAAQPPDSLVEAAAAPTEAPAPEPVAEAPPADEPPPAPAVDAEAPVPMPAPPVQAEAQAQDEGVSEALFEETSAALADSVPLTPVPLEAAVAPRAEPPAQPPVAPLPVLHELAPTLALTAASPTSPFLLTPEGLCVAVEGELLTRLQGLLAASGALEFQPEMKRFRGRATGKPFGEGASRMVRASGRGVLHLTPPEGRRFLAVDLGEESAYLRDECVFAFEEPVMFENGRVPSDVAPDLELVHLRGQGRVLLSLAGALRSLPVRAEQPVTVPLAHLVGWQGNVTPRVVALLRGPGGEPLQMAVELGGEGFALICLPVR